MSTRKIPYGVNIIDTQTQNISSVLFLASETPTLILCKDVFVSKIPSFNTLLIKERFKNTKIYTVSWQRILCVYVLCVFGYPMCCPPIFSRSCVTDQRYTSHLEGRVHSYNILDPKYVKPCSSTPEQRVKHSFNKCSIHRTNNCSG